MTLHTLDEQIDMFNMFHDGTIIALVKEENSINFEIDIPYLAELINPEFSSFKGKLMECTEFCYKEWDEDSPIADLASIEKLDLGILDAKLHTEGSIVVSCWNSNLGGELTIKAEDIIIYDQSNRMISYKELIDLCHSYWCKFGEEK